MRNKLFLTVIVVLFTGAALSQTNAPPPLESSFRANVDGWHELDYRSAISHFPGLSESQRASLTNVVAAQLRPFMKELEIGSDSELMRVAGHSRIEFVDLNGDGEPEVIAQAYGGKSGCGATGNCPLWVFEKVDGNYRPILDGTERHMGEFRFLRSGLNELMALII